MSGDVRIRAVILSFVLLGVFALGWHAAVSGTGEAPDMDPEYAKLMGITAKGGSAMPGPGEVAKQIWDHISDPFYV